jgi:hypothetical protein
MELMISSIKIQLKQKTFIKEQGSLELMISSVKTQLKQNTFIKEQGS